jgi:hypothetical protein
MSDTYSDSDTTSDSEQELLAPPPELLSLTAWEEHLMIAAGEEEKLLMSGERMATLAEPPMIEVIAPVTPLIPIAAVTLPITEDLFADLPVSPVEKSIVQDMEPTQILNQAEDKTVTDTHSLGNTISLPLQGWQILGVSPTPCIIEPIQPTHVASALSSTGHVDDCPSTAFYEKEHGVHTTPSSHVGILIAIWVLALSILGAGAWYVMGGKQAHTSDVAYTIRAEAPATYQESIDQQRTDHAHDIDLQNRAMSEQNLTLCASIIDPTMQLDCSESVQAVIYTQSGTLEDCQMLTLTGIRDRCSATLAQSSAFARMDKTLCAKIETPTQQLYCREEIDARVLASLIETKSATEATCTTLEAKYQQDCLSSIARIDDNAILQDAIRTDALELCKKLSTEDLRYTCFDAILMKRALISGDKNNCDYLHDEDKKATCLARTTIQDDNAIFKKAITDKNLSLCKTIGNDTLENRCHDSVTLLLIRESGDATLCDTLTNTGTIASCKKMTPSAQ